MASFERTLTRGIIKAIFPYTSNMWKLISETFPYGRDIAKSFFYQESYTIPKRLNCNLKKKINHDRSKKRNKKRNRNENIILYKQNKNVDLIPFECQFRWCRMQNSLSSVVLINIVTIFAITAFPIFSRYRKAFISCAVYTRFDFYAI